MKEKGKRILIVIAIIVAVLAISFAYYKLFMDPYRGSVKEFEQSKSLDNVWTEEEAREDLSYLMKCFKEHHPAYLDGSDELVEMVDEQYQKELEQMPDEMSELELWQCAGRIIAKFGDGHSWVNYNAGDEECFINDFTQFEEYGCPIRVNGEDTEVIRKRFLEQFFYESEEYANSTFEGQYLSGSKERMQYCGIDVSNGVTMTFQTENGEKEFHYTFVPFGLTVHTADDSYGNEEWVRYKIDKEHNLGIFTLTECVYNQEYKNAVMDFFAEVREAGITNIVVDLRANGGGNSTVADYFLTYLDVDKYQSWGSDIRFGWLLWKNKAREVDNKKRDSVFSGNVYALTSVYTYSSATDFTMLLEDNQIGTIVGETSGNDPEGYGDCIFFQLPNSKLTVSVSGKSWHRIDRDKAGELLIPNVEVKSEEALDKVYELIKE